MKRRKILQSIRRGLAISVSFVGLIASIGLSFHDVRIGIEIFFVVVFTVVAWLWWTSGDYLTEGDAEAAILNEKFTVRNEANPVLILQTNFLARNAFGKNSINQKNIIKMYEKSPKSLITIFREDGEMIGYTDFFIVEDYIADRILSGSLDERKLKEDHIIAIKEQLYIKKICVYFAGVVVTESIAFRRGKCLEILLWSLLKQLIHLCELSKVEEILGIATASSPNGEKFLSKLGFSKSGKQGKIGVIMTRAFTRGDLKEMYENMPDFSKYIDVNI